MRCSSQTIRAGVLLMVGGLPCSALAEPASEGKAAQQVNAAGAEEPAAGSSGSTGSNSAEDSQWNELLSAADSGSPEAAPDSGTEPSQSESPDAGSASVASSEPRESAPVETPMGSDSAAYASIPVPPRDNQLSPEPKKREHSRGIEEIVVTARRTEENLQDVPVAISVMTNEDLRREQIDDMQDLQGRVPSLIIGPAGQQRNTETPTIRGQGATYGASPGVVLYFAEVPLPNDSVSNNQGGPGKFFDLGNAQVLKGSQGTLFGRNTTGGAVLLTPARPTDAHEGYLMAETSSYNGRGFEGVFNVPFSESLLFRGGAKLLERDGFTKDVVTGKDYDSKGYWTGRIGLTWRATDQIENYLMGYYASNSDNGTGNVLKGINSEGFNAAILAIAGLQPLPGVPAQAQPGCLFFNSQTGSLNCGQDLVAEQNARGRDRVQLSADPTDNLDTGGITDIFTWELSESLTLRNIASYAFYQHQFRWDYDGSRARLDDINTPDRYKQSDTELWTEELQLQGQALDSRLVYVVGGYYESSRPVGRQYQPADVMFFPSAMNYGSSRHSYAPYAQGTYDFGGRFPRLEGLKLTAGIRYTYDYSRGFSDYQGYHVGVVKDSAPTYTAGLDYKISDATMVYAKYSHGYKTGGFMGLAVNPQNYFFEPEYVDNYEVGLKTDFEAAGMPARLNSALYYTDYDNLQRTAGDSYTPPDPGSTPAFGGATYNVGNAYVGGLELDGTIQPTERLQLSASYSYTKAEYQEFRLFVGALTPQRDCTGRDITNGNYADMSCIPYQFVARHQYSLSGRYQLPLDERYGEVSLHSSYSWMDKQYTAPISVPSAEPGAWISPFGILNASAEWARILGSRFSLQAYVTNALDENYRISNSNVWNVLYFQSVIYGEPRTYGMQLRYHWGQ